MSAWEVQKESRCLGMNEWTSVAKPSSVPCPVCGSLRMSINTLSVCFWWAGLQKPCLHVWLAGKSLLWRVLLWHFFFFLPIKCEKQDSWRPFEVCTCVCSSITSSFSGDEPVRWDPKLSRVIFPRQTLCHFDSAVTWGGDKEATNTSHKFFFLFLQCQNLIQRGLTLSANVCVRTVSHKRLLAPCLQFVRGFLCLEVIMTLISTLL